MSGMNGNGMHGSVDDEIVPGGPNICVFTASALGNDPDVQRMIDEFVELAVSAGYGFTYGGGHAGNMGILAKAVERRKGRLIGVMPPFLEAREGRAGYGTHLVATAGMHKRKRMMFKNSEAFAVFPGGLGTLEELAEMMTWEQLGQHKKPVVLANVNGFWDPLVALFSLMIERGYAGYPGKEIRLRIANRAKDILPFIRGEREPLILRTAAGDGSSHPARPEMTEGQLSQL